MFNFRFRQMSSCRALFHGAFLEKDDGGKGGMTFWAGPDAVWPSAATTEEADAADNAALKK